MKKILSLAVVAICLLAGTISCSKESILVARYGFDTAEFANLSYVTGHEDAATDFIADLNAVTSRFDGTEFTESEIVSAYDAVVSKHNNKYIQGTFSLYKYDVDTNEKIGTAKTWTMTVAN